MLSEELGDEVTFESLFGLRGYIKMLRGKVDSS